MGGEQSETISYWDPGKTMYDYALNLTCGAAPADDASDEAKATYNACKETVTPGVTGNYFSIASESLLGTAQSAQFHSDNQKGSSWYWGTKCAPTPSDASTISEVTSTTCDYSNAGYANVLTAMPRSYYDANHVGAFYYNWHAAVAESLGYSTDGPATAAQDSICPRGWTLKRAIFNVSNTYYDGTLRKATQIPLGLTRYGRYDYPSGTIDTTSLLNYHDAYSYRTGSYYTFVNNNVTISRTATPKPYGRSIRCSMSQASGS